jgi:cysteine desulfurase / selenocysteine lyase
MATNTVLNWRKEWFEIEDATYLNIAAHAVMPRVSIRAVEASLEAKKYPHRVDDSLWFAAPNRIRHSLSKMIGGKPEEFAVTSGASAGAAVVAQSLDWKLGDEIIIVQGEFPLHYATWKPMEERERVKLKVVTPREQFVSADDLIDALTPRTRIVSVSLVRYDDGSLLDAARVAAACHAQGTLLLLDVSQACGAIPINLTNLGADFVICAGYKWLLSCYGTGFFWVNSAHFDTLRPGPFNWTGQDADELDKLNFVDPIPVRAAKRWDAAEWATSYNFNLSAMAESVDFVLRMGPEVVTEHNRNLIDFMFSRLPEDRCVPASPLDSKRRGPFGCFAAREPEKTVELYQKLRWENVVVALRGANIRVAPYLFNSEQDIERLIDVVRE